jgi:membrane-bound lytic murein transglycosylase D
MVYRTVQKLLIAFGLLMLMPAATLQPVTSSAANIREDSLLCKPVNEEVAPKTKPLFSSPGKKVVLFITNYVREEREFLQLMKKRSTAFFPVIEKVFDAYQLPEELKYLAIVESELRNKVLSPMGAGGLWQLMPGTARELGLTTNGNSDERMQTYRSTVAAAKYLRSLHASLGDWLLVLAAYNSGPGTIFKAIKKSGSRNYWSLEQYLPAESRGHVRRFMGIHHFFEQEMEVAKQGKVGIDDPVI